MQFEDAVQYINSLINYERTHEWAYPEAVKLDRMRELAKEWGQPQNAYPTAIIAGSKGKGSTSAILASILRMEGLRVGLYTSPHLDDIRERIRVNGLLISPTRFAELTRELQKLIDGSYHWRKDPPTYFEALTAIAFRHFRELKVHVAVLEVGLGGLYDSTNIAEAKVAGLAPISLDHTDKLGRTLAKIAVQKCGILKGREWVVSAPQAAEAAAVVERVAEEKEASLYRVGKEIRVLEREFGPAFQRFDVRAPFVQIFDLETSLLGRHQLDNAAVAIGLAKGLEARARLPISAAALRRGVLDVQWPGRLERIADRPCLVVDGAQNGDSARRLMEGLRRHFTFSKLVTVLGVSADKDVDAILDALAPETALLVATRSASPRALQPSVLAERASDRGLEVRVETDSAAALETARKAAGEEGLIVGTGSLFLVAELRALVLGS